MKEMVRYGVILGVICMVASGLLAVVYAVTEPRIASQAKAEEQAVFAEVLPGMSRFDPVTDNEAVLYYKAYDSAGNLAGAVFKATGKGYSSEITTIVGLKRDGTIAAIKVTGQNETPGLGSKVTEEAFSSRFAGLQPEKVNEVQAITGATISSTAVIDSVREAAAKVKGLLDDAG